MLQHLQPWQTADVTAGRATPYAFAECDGLAPPFPAAPACQSDDADNTNVNNDHTDGNELPPPCLHSETAELLRFQWPSRPRLPVARRRECLVAGRMSYDGECARFRYDLHMIQSVLGRDTRVRQPCCVKMLTSADFSKATRSRTSVFIGNSSAVVALRPRTQHMRAASACGTGVSTLRRQAPHAHLTCTAPGLPMREHYGRVYPSACAVDTSTKLQEGGGIARHSTPFAARHRHEEVAKTLTATLPDCRAIDVRL